jgi:hypothetical protein
LQQRRDALVAIATKFAGEGNNGLGQPIFVFALRQLAALRVAWLVHQLARSPFTHPTLAAMVYRNASASQA